jgi:hypothetical protein
MAWSETEDHLVFFLYESECEVCSWKSNVCLAPVPVQMVLQSSVSTKCFNISVGHCMKLSEVCG